MENPTSLTNSIIQNNSNPITFSETTTSDSGFFSSLLNIGFMTWVIIILILAFLGFNIFIYLAKGPQDIKSFFNTIYQKLFGENTTQTTEHKNVNTATEVENSKLPSTVKGEYVENTVQQPDAVEETSLNKSLNSSEPQEPHNDYRAHDASTSLDINGKAGWCYIGEDRGFRSCAQVGVNDKCMSGDIFPTQEICINPNLRK